MSDVMGGYVLSVKRFTGAVRTATVHATTDKETSFCGRRIWTTYHRFQPYDKDFPQSCKRCSSIVRKTCSMSYVPMYGMADPG